MVHLPQLMQELEQLEGLESGRGRLVISDRAHLLFDLHMAVDGWQENALGKDGIGTTRRGIGPCYMTKMERSGLRVGDLRDWPLFETRLRSIVRELQRKYAGVDCDIEKEIDKYRELRDRVLPMVVDTVPLVNGALREGRRVLLEGANAHLLDIDFGTYPFVTSSSTTAGGACTGLGIPPSRIGSVYGVVKAYTTRVGSGPFPTELHDTIGEWLQEKGHEYGTTTGRRRRCGWIDVVALRFAHMVNDFTSLCLTKLDVLSGLQEVKIGVKYTCDGKPVEHFPQSLEFLSKCKVEYEVMQGWDEDISKVRNFNDLPQNCQRYVRRLEELIGCRIQWIGVGPDRDDMIYME